MSLRSLFRHGGICFVLMVSLGLTFSAQGEDKSIQVSDVNALYQALVKAKGHTGDLLEIVLADGEYKTDRTLELIAAEHVRISAPKGASILCSDNKAAVLLVAYCSDIDVSRLTLRHVPGRVSENFDDVVRIDHSQNVRLASCSLEFSIRDAVEGNLNISPKVAKELGKEILAIIREPDEIQTFKLNPTTIKGEKMLGQHAILQAGPPLSQTQKKLLIDLITEEKTYIFGISKLGFHVPEHGFKFIKGKDEVGLLVDLYRKELVFLFHGKEKTENCDHAADILAGLVKELFPAEAKNEPKK